MSSVNYLTGFEFYRYNMVDLQTFFVYTPGETGVPGPKGNKGSTGMDGAIGSPGIYCFAVATIETTKPFASAKQVANEFSHYHLVIALEIHLIVVGIIKNITIYLWH